MALETYEIVNDSWKSTSKILFGQVIGELREFEDYMKPTAIGQSTNSSFSGKPIFVLSAQYSPNTKFFDYSNELGEFNKLASKPLDINKIKDLDSLVESVQEKLIYGGNKIFGISKLIEHSDTIMDSTGIYNCSMIIRGKYLAYSYLMRDNEYTFGSTSSSESSHILRCCYNTSLQRCFELSYSVGSSDCYLSYNCHQCTDCMFSFNLRAKRFMVGNVQLDKSSYQKLKSKILGELASELKSKKKLRFSIFDIMNW